MQDLIIATIALNSANDQVIRKMAEYVTIFRVNGSHCRTPRDLVSLVELISTAAPGASIAYDTRGREKRLGELPQAMDLEAGQVVELAANNSADDGLYVRLPLNDPELLAGLEAADSVVVNDGQVVLRVEANHESVVQCRVVRGGQVSSRKNIMAPRLPVSGAVVPEEEEAMLEAVRRLETINWVFLSFTQSTADIEWMRRRVQREIAICAKPENLPALHHIHEITQAADMTMVPRGDLRQAVGSRLPDTEKMIIRTCCEVAGKPCVVATGVATSMVWQPMLSQAEETAIWALLDAGCTGFMVSNETVQGRYPVEAVREIRGCMEAYAAYGM